jgi:hypothetical protein
MKEKQGKEEVVVIGIIDNGIIEDEQEENSGYPKQGRNEGPCEIIQPGSAVNVVVEPRKIVKSDPRERKSEGARPETGTKFNGHLHPEYLGLDLNFSEQIKKDPGSGCGQKIKQYVEKPLVPVVLHQWVSLCTL